MIEKAYSKINISLDIVGKNKDGYHELDMIMVPLDFYDVLTIEVAEKMSFECNAELAWDKHNIVYQAVNLLKKNFNLSENFKIKLEKNIPMQAGLGGGSSDAAATLRAIDELCDLFMPDEMMNYLAKQLGADVPFCLWNKPSRVKGIGDELEFFSLEKGYDVLLIKPSEGVSTQEAYKLIDSMDYDHPDIDGILNGFVKHEELKLANVLENSAFELCPVIKDIKEECIRSGYPNTLMSGSGSCLFVLTEIGTDTSLLEEKMAQKGNFVKKTSCFLG